MTADLAAALERAGLSLDARDMAGALPVFRFLEQAKRLLRDADERR